MIVLNGIEIATVAPSDLAASLVADTGFGIHEVDRLIDATPGMAARALVPFLTADEPSVSIIAAAIDADPRARDVIRDLYAAAAAAAEVSE